MYCSLISFVFFIIIFISSVPHSFTFHLHSNGHVHSGHFSCPYQLHKKYGFETSIPIVLKYHSLPIPSPKAHINGIGAHANDPENDEFESRTYMFRLFLHVTPSLSFISRSMPMRLNLDLNDIESGSIHMTSGTMGYKLILLFTIISMSPSSDF